MSWSGLDLDSLSSPSCSWNTNQDFKTTRVTLVWQLQKQVARRTPLTSGTPWSQESLPQNEIACGREYWEVRMHGFQRAAQPVNHIFTRGTITSFVLASGTSAGEVCNGSRPQLCLAAFDVPATWNALRSFRDTTKATFIFFIFFSSSLLPKLVNEVCRIQCERLEFKAVRKNQVSVKTRHQSKCIVLRTYFHMVFWRQTVPNTSPLPGGAYSKSVPTDYLNEGHSRFCHPASALQSTSKHFVGVHFVLYRRVPPLLAEQKLKI